MYFFVVIVKNKIVFKIFAAQRTLYPVLLNAASVHLPAMFLEVANFLGTVVTNDTFFGSKVMLMA